MLVAGSEAAGGKENYFLFKNINALRKIFSVEKVSAVLFFLRKTNK